MSRREQIDWKVDLALADADADGSDDDDERLTVLSVESYNGGREEEDKRSPSKIMASFCTKNLATN